jgi:hypothetical protein
LYFPGSFLQFTGYRLSVKINLKYLVAILGILLAAAGFLPLMSKNGISVNGFRPELGLGVGYWLLGLGITVALLSFAGSRKVLKLSLGLAGVSFLMALNTSWQAHKLDALAWGCGLLAVLAAVLIAALTARIIQGR